MSANVYLNPKVLDDYLELHVVAAELVQNFIEQWAIVIAQKFKERRIAHQWRQDTLEQQPLASAPHRDSHPLIPQPCDIPSGSYFEFIGRAPGPFKHPLHSHFPHTSGVTVPKTVTWHLQQREPIMSDVICGLQDVRLGDERADEETLGVSYADALQVYAESLPPSIRAGDPHLPTENHYIHPSVRAKILVPATMTTSLATKGRTSSSGASLLPISDTFHEEDTAVEEVLEYIQNKAMELATRFHKSPCRYLEHFYIGSALRHQKRKKMNAWSAFMHFKGMETNQGQYNFPSYFHNFNSLVTRDNVRKLVKRASDYHDLSAEECKQLVIAFDEEKEAARHRPPNLFKAIVDKVEALKQWIGTEALVILVHGTCNLNIKPKVHFTSSAVEQYHRTATQKHVMEFACKLEGYVISGGLSLTHKERVKKAKQTIRGVAITGCLEANFEYLHYEHVVQKFLVKVVGWTHSDWANPNAVEGKICKFVTITQEEANEHLKCIAAGETLMPNMDKDTSLSRDINVEPSKAPPQTPVQQTPTTSALTTATSSHTTAAATSLPTNANVITSTSSKSTATSSALPNNTSLTQISDSQIDPSLLNNGGEGVSTAATAPSIPLTPSAIPPVPTPNCINPTPQFIFPTPDLTPSLTVCPASLSDPSGAQDMSALTAGTNHKWCAPAAPEELRSKCPKKPSARALAAETAKGGQRKKKGKGGRAKKDSKPKSAAYVDSKHENDPTPT
ncbi:uncharacterized protein EDB91DRAFT_1078960 [Suillus paluster]|uniref:uncharacterized protein n=1 Tax=Suillus paluster TaxID=48578 RepID=UPI001B863BDA|nr:uncharacterized protein EDB91DRAFT_1078960 [Suillus paluster]KAG1750033.1 hypothetical protein EDB91DRAFT_1078960 [Suillus paluster]